MTSPSREYLRSQFENVFQILPQGHDKALKKAFYSTGATLFVVLACCAVVTLYHILLPFIRPLLWALLCGTVLFPFKYQLVTVARGWLHGLQSSGTPLVVGTLLLPVTVADALAVSFVSVALNYALPVAIGCIITLAAYMIIYVWLGRAFIDILFMAFYFVYDTVGYFKAFWVCCSSMKQYDLISVCVMSFQCSSELSYMFDPCSESICSTYLVWNVLWCLTLERLNGSFLTHSELQLHVVQGRLTLEAKYFITFLKFMYQIRHRSWYMYSQSHSWVIIIYISNAGSGLFWPTVCTLLLLVHLHNIWILKWMLSI